MNAARAAFSTPAPSSSLIGLSRDELIHHLRVKPETVDGWLSGALKRPPYFDLAVKAAKIGLHPISATLVYNYHKELGVEEQRARFWRDTGQVPAPARMAVAWVIHSRVTGRT
jgi:hypothetical protein